MSWKGKRAKLKGSGPFDLEIYVVRNGQNDTDADMGESRYVLSEAIEDAVELAFRRVDAPLARFDWSVRTIADAEIRVAVLDFEPRGSSVNIALEIVEPMLFTEKPGLEELHLPFRPSKDRTYLWATYWESNSWSVIHNRDSLVEHVRKQATALARKFCLAYLRANSSTQ